ncbi:Two-component response regulator [Parasponia andersonii]|uniref:Two-component response regulator n=1 Tax=Parasponia andersonii TaxID=3476 RepID=A0A2P5BRI2_PARAD|nr:Two-component response regulator [Parasponia andersonii]
MAPAYFSPSQARASGDERLPPRRNPFEEDLTAKGNSTMTWRNRLTAIVVDSGSLCRRIVRGVLAVYGVETEAVDGGSAAVERINAGARFDLIVIDPNLTGMSGMETCRELRAMAPQSRIVGLSAYYNEVERMAFLEAGGDDYFEKPFGPDKFIPILRELDNQ